MRGSSKASHHSFETRLQTPEAKSLLFVEVGLSRREVRGNLVAFMATLTDRPLSKRSLLVGQK